MQNIVKYLAPVNATLYIIVGIWILFGNANFQFQYSKVLGGLCVFYGIFRFYRYFKMNKNQNNAVE